MRPQVEPFLSAFALSLWDSDVTEEGVLICKWYFDRKLREFLLPYAVVRTSSEPETALMAFLEAHIGKAHIGLQPILAVGIAPRSNVRWANPSDRAP
jgi:hypothetical protein